MCRICGRYTWCRKYIDHLQLSFFTFFWLQDFPAPVAAALIGRISPVVRIVGDGCKVFDVMVEVQGDCLCFTSGWDAFVQSEKPVKGDMGMFVMVEPDMFEFILMGSDGAYKPMSLRPAAWNLFVAHDDELQDKSAWSMSNYFQLPARGRAFVRVFDRLLHLKLVTIPLPIIQFSFFVPFLLVIFSLFSVKMD